MGDRIYILFFKLYFCHRIYSFYKSKILSLLAKSYFKTTPCIIMLILALIQIPDLHLLGV